MPDSIEPPYDMTNLESIIEYAGKLTDHTLHQMLGEVDLDPEIRGDLHSKGYFGQFLERGYFVLENNNSPTPDFAYVDMELKTAPLERDENNRLKSKERMVLGIIDYEKVPTEGFHIFLKKSAHILMVFFEWRKGQSILDYRIDKVVDWEPSEEELRIIHEDWDVIEKFIMDGRAEELSERHTRFLAACRKGAGGDRDLRSQPFSDNPALQRALSFKPSFVNHIYQNRQDVNKVAEMRSHQQDSDSVLKDWKNDESFEQHVIRLLMRYSGRTCREIEMDLGIELSDCAKSYYRLLTNRMMDVKGETVKEFEQSGISMKTVRLLVNGKPKESMSFPAFDYERISTQDWEDSDFYEQMDRRFLFVVFSFRTGDPRTEKRKDLIFRTAFFWSMPEDELGMVEWVWEDTRQKILSEDFDNFMRESDNRLVHVRPHARDSNDTLPFNGKQYIKRGFWFNKNYLEQIIKPYIEDENQ